MDGLQPIRVGLDRSVASFGTEVKYVFRTLLRLAGYPYTFVWAGDAAETEQAERLDIYYGPLGRNVAAAIHIATGEHALTKAAACTPEALLERDSLPFLTFDDRSRRTYTREGNQLFFFNDIVFASYWLLTGAQEPAYPRDRWDNLHLQGSFFLDNALATKPLVSLYAALLRTHFQHLGRTPLDLPWASTGRHAAFAFSHDVDYPQMIRWIECLRLLRARGRQALPSIREVWRGTNHFWTFDEWVALARQYGTRPTFYFMARRGSLLQYVLGTPDAFYDIHTPAFQTLFQRLGEEGCEVGLHASYNAYRDVRQMQAEKEHLEEAAGVAVVGNRNHYWHLDPTAPHETLHKLEQAGLHYDSSLAFEMVPGFRRGLCHPFRPFHPGLRRELDLIEIPPAWMDDHFDHRLAHNQITDPNRYAQGLVDTAQATNGIIVVDYHVRGMNADFFPRYGPWLTDFVQHHLDASMTFSTTRDLARDYAAYEKTLEQHGVDYTQTVS